MDIKDPNFFKLNYLCLNKIDSISNQCVIIKKNIGRHQKNQRNKSNKSSILKMPSTPKYYKLDNTNTNNQLKEKNSYGRKSNWSRTKVDNKKNSSNICLSYYTINDKNDTIFGYPNSFSPTTPIYRGNKQKSYRINLYNKIMAKSNNYKKNNKFSSGKNVSQDNISNGKIINNNTLNPMTEEKYNYLNNSNSYFHTNVVFKIDRNSNCNNKIYKSSFHRLTPDKKRSLNLKHILEVSNNSFNNNHLFQIDNNRNYHICYKIKKHSKTKKCIEEEKVNESKTKNSNYKITYKLCNNSILLGSQGIKSDLNKIKDKKNIKLILNTLKKDNFSSNNKLKIKKFNNNKTYKTIKYIEKTINSKSFLSSENKSYKCKINTNTNTNNMKIYESNGGENLDEYENLSILKFFDKNLKNEIPKIKENKSNKTGYIKNNILIINNKELDSKIEENKFSNDKLQNNNKVLKTQKTRNERNMNLNKKDIIKLKDEIMKLSNENDTLKISLKNSLNIKLKNKIMNRNSPLNKAFNNNKKNKTINITQINELNKNIKKIKKQKELYEKEVENKNKLIKELNDTILELKKNIEDKDNKIKLIEKNLEELKNENDNLYKYKSLNDDKEIELIQYKNCINKLKSDSNKYDSLKIEYDELLCNYNKIKEYKDKYISILKEVDKLKHIEKNYNDLYDKYNYIKEESKDIDELKEIKNKYNDLLKQNNKLNDIKNKYDKIKNEFEELKQIREKYGKILKEQKNFILMENKYNDLLEEVKELREIKCEYKKMAENKESSKSDLFRFHNFSFGEYGNI